MALGKKMLQDKIKNQYKKPRKKKPTYRDYEKKLDRIFSEYIRLRDSDDNGYCKCITCGEVKHYKNMHNGHFISRSVKAVRFNEINCNAQCVRCNSFRQGEHHIYRDKLIELYGIDGVEKLETKARFGESLNIIELQELIEKYKEKIKALKKERGII